jgi:hypothetical protein
MAVANLKLCVYYLKDMERVQGQPVVNAINLVLVCSYRNQQYHEVGFKKTVEEPVINDKDWPITLETIREYLASQYGVTGATLDHAVRPDIAVFLSINLPFGITAGRRRLFVVLRFILFAYAIFNCYTLSFNSSSINSVQRAYNYSNVINNTT